MRLRDCRVCGAADARFLCRNFNEHSRTRWLTTCRCSACGSAFIADALDEAEIAEAYATIDEAAYYRETSAASAAKFDRAARNVAALAAPQTAILDIGGGHGAFARALRSRGLANLWLHEIPGIEMPDLSGIVQGVFRDTNYGSIPATAFGIVTLMDVMEHVVDVDRTIAAARRVLCGRGFLYIHTPVETRLDRLMHAMLRLPLIGGLARAWQRSRTSIFHLQSFTPRALRHLAERHGFEVVSLDCINELSWPVERYVRVYLVERAGLPAALAPFAVTLLTPLLRSPFNLNKAVLVARASAPPAAGD